MGASLFLALLALGPGAAFAAGASAGMPRNAHAKSYGPGWECNMGYREVDKACAAVKVPANGYVVDATFGRGWQCPLERDYTKYSEIMAHYISLAIQDKIPVDSALSAVSTIIRSERLAAGGR